MKSVRLIDTVLYLLATDILLRPFTTDGKIFEALLTLHPELKDRIFTGADLLAVLDKLVEDNYVRRYPYDVYDGGGLVVFHTEIRYSITFGGGMFYKQGGYAKKIRRQTISANLQSLQTWAIVFGTVFAAISTTGLLIFEYLKYNKTYPFGIHSLHKFFFGSAIGWCLALIALLAVLTLIILPLLKRRNKSSTW